jgi:hypothetical protein
MKHDRRPASFFRFSKLLPLPAMAMALSGAACATGSRGDPPARNVTTSPFPASAGAKPVPANQTVNILFVGNSFVFVHGVNHLVCRLAVAGGRKPPVMHAQLMGGSRLSQHLARIEKEGDENVIFKAMPKGETWDFLVIQEFSSGPTTVSDPTESIRQFHENALKLYNIVAKHSPGVTAILYETWARPVGPSGEESRPYTTEYTQEKMQQELHENYSQAARNIAAMDGASARLAPCGQVWKRLKWSLDLYGRQKDKNDPTKKVIDYHQGPRGALLNAMVLCSAIYGDSIGEIDPETCEEAKKILLDLDLQTADWKRLADAVREELRKGSDSSSPTKRSGD